jgi:NADH-quinone oxidoreductase subunit N
VIATTAKVVLPHIDYLAIMPELILLGGAILVLLVASMTRGGMKRNAATATTVAIGVAALIASIVGWFHVSNHGASVTIDSAISLDAFAAFVSIIISCTLILATLIGHAYLERAGISTTEYHVLALASAAGAIMMGQANDLIVLFLGLEILSIALYVLAAFNPLRGESGEAALKYFILGGFSSAVFVYGIALVYGATGSTNYSQIADFLSLNQLVHSGLLYAGIGLLLVGFAFKVAAVPFHLWTPDVYQGSPTPVTGYMAAVAKAGAFAGMLRVLFSVFGTQSSTWQPIVYALAVASLVLGALVALPQRDVKRMLAYSSINHTGFILLGVEAATVAGFSASAYYLFAYAIMTVGTFGILALLGGPGDSNHDLAGYRGLARRHPVLGGCLVVLLLAQAGAPFTTGFLAKFGVVAASVGAGSWPLAVIAMATAAIAAFFYLRVAVLAVSPLKDDDDTAAIPSDASAATVRATSSLLLEDEVETAPAPITVSVAPIGVVAVVIATATTVFFGVVPGPLLDMAHAVGNVFIP